MRSIDITRALEIPGWMSEQELRWLARAASGAHRIAELGSWRGRSTRAMADNTQGFIFAVDTWSDEAIGIPGYWTTTKERPDSPGWLWREFCKNISDCLNVTTYRMTTREAAVALGWRKFDIIFIDASHDTASVEEDIRLWRPLLAPGGTFCGHDYGHVDCPDVKPAVDALVGKVDVIDTIWCATC